MVSLVYLILALVFLAPGQGGTRRMEIGCGEKLLMQNITLGTLMCFVLQSKMLLVFGKD
jgi:hypothetical protein